MASRPALVGKGFLLDHLSAVHAAEHRRALRLFSRRVEEPRVPSFTILAPQWNSSIGCGGRIGFRLRHKRDKDGLAGSQMDSGRPRSSKYVPSLLF